MINISVQSNIAEVLRKFEGLQMETGKAVAMALNRTAATARSRATKAISAETGIKQASIREKLQIVRATRTALRAEIQAHKYAPNLIHYTARQTKAGVSANAWRKRKVYKHTFIGNKGRTVFHREGKARLPIKPVYGPSIPRTFMQRTTNRVLRETVAERFPIEFERALKVELRKLGFSV